jgi:hypothetical protein
LAFATVVNSGVIGPAHLPLGYAHGPLPLPLAYPPHLVIYLKDFHKKYSSYLD